MHKLERQIKENLPTIKEKLIEKYTQEKEAQLHRNTQNDFVSERKEENKTFFKLRENKEKIAEKEEKQEINQEPVKSRIRR